ncbi:hypothetical protein [Azospirillum brasilense]|uniref:Uncharacterized protein n=1 Tax=Azospirillum brasilense TaxID=192 RepID=A0A235H9N5_AZOBR|nr:hypothetical protein [Azospirillum brasilense]OYD82529.1 hypothetical protein CHT98_20240 [Azospirillum brasilense]
MSGPLNTPSTSSTWAPYPFLIATIVGPMAVDFGAARGPFGLHGEKGGWHLTHLPTGALIGVAPSIEAAMDAADGIEGIWDWSIVGRPEDATMKVIREALRSHGVTSPTDYPAWKPALEIAA